MPSRNTRPRPRDERDREQAESRILAAALTMYATRHYTEQDRKTHPMVMVSLVNKGGGSADQHIVNLETGELSDVPWDPD